MARISCALALMLAVQLGVRETTAVAEEAQSAPFAQVFDHWPLDYQFPGNVIASKNPEFASIASSLSDREKSRRVGILVDRETSVADRAALWEIFESAREVRLLREKVDEQTARLDELLESCDTVVWWSQKVVPKSLIDSLALHREGVESFLSRDKTLVLLGQTAPLAGDHFDAGEEDESRLVRGLGAIPGSLVEFTEDPAVGKTVATSLLQLPGTVGITASNETLIHRRGRIIFPVGDEAAIYLHLPKGIQQDAISVRYPRDASAGNRVRQRKANEFLADLTQWRRRAIDLHLPMFPAAEPPQPVVPNGTLVIVGGGGTPRGLMQKFIDYAGGVESAKLVYVPCTDQEQVSARQSTIEQWKRMGVQHAAVLHTKDRQKADRDEAFLAPLKDATGIWFGGGRQWNFADSYYGTRAQTLMHEVLERGGVIGGSSAGASIQADFLARATPIENFKIIAPGYIRGGLGFLPGVAIDQHFTQRRRQADMSQLIAKYPQVLGIGIDESTAIIVQQSEATVTGRGDVYFYDAEAEGQDEYLRLSAGKSYDLVERRECQQDE